MKKMYTIIIILLAVVVGGYFFFRHPRGPKSTVMDSDTAYSYVKAWAKAEKSDIPDYIQRDPNGNFQGKVATLGFEYSSTNQLLIVRGRVLPDAEDLIKYKDIMDELNRIAREEPKRVNGARFDLVKSPWETDVNQPTLYLRLDYNKANLSFAEMFNQWRELRETAYLWHRTYFSEAVGPIVDERLKREGK